MAQESAWIEMLFSRRYGATAFSTPFLPSSFRNSIAESLSQVPDGAQALHAASVRRLNCEKAEPVLSALLALSLVGSRADIALIEPLKSSSNECIRNAATTCLFEIIRKE